MNVRLKTGRGDSEKSSHTLQQTMQHTAAHGTTLQQCVAALHKQGVALLHEDGRCFIILIFSYICIYIYIYTYSHICIHTFTIIRVHLHEWIVICIYLFKTVHASVCNTKDWIYFKKVWLGRTIMYTRIHMYTCICIHLNTVLPILGGFG